jgi:D-sedoheptulose 7-phosphate isomerase
LIARPSSRSCRMGNMRENVSDMHQQNGASSRTELERDAVTYLEGLRKIINTIDVTAIATVTERLIAVNRRQGHIYVCGNGGSASTAAHLVNDFNKAASADARYGFRCHSLSDNVPMLTAVANDINYDDVFVCQLRNYLDQRDAVIAISSRGNSPNIINAVRYAKARGVETFGLTGYDGGLLRTLADYSIVVPADNMRHVEDVHLALNHLIVTLLSRRLHDLS